ncbi:MAG TPA: hypothetical protein VHF00_08160 [Acidimicrobiales bacterium]|nr:hypothetical protein [Acidimicrobiales bacterium]
MRETSHDDPVRSRRARIGRLASIGRRLGYGSLGVAVVAFFAGAATTFTPAVVAVVVAAMAVGSVVLLPAIIVGYGVRAADREDRQRGLR